MADRRHTRHELVAAYKGVLRECIDRRPSGIRQRIAVALGTHRSFVSQITNPADPTAIPARHVPTILALVHATEEERARFAATYEEAHPRALERAENAASAALTTVSVDIPVLPDPAAQAALEDLIRMTAHRLAAIARMQARNGVPDEDREDRE